jgi:hypothetical protein
MNKESRKRDHQARPGPCHSIVRQAASSSFVNEDTRIHTKSMFEFSFHIIADWTSAQGKVA